MTEKVLSAYERAVDDGLFNTDGAPSWAVRDVGQLYDRCCQLDTLRKTFQAADFPDDDIREEQVGFLDDSVATLVSYVTDIWEKVQSDHDLLPYSKADHRRDMMEAA